MLASVYSYTLTNSVLTPNMCALPNHRHSQNDTGAPGHPGDVHSPAVSAQHTAAGLRPASMTRINVLCKTRLPSSYTLLNRFLDLPVGATDLSLPGRSEVLTCCPQQVERRERSFSLYTGLLGLSALHTIHIACRDPQRGKNCSGIAERGSWGWGTDTRRNDSS